MSSNLQMKLLAKETAIYRQVLELAVSAAIHLCAATAVGLWYRNELICVDGTTLGDSYLWHGNGLLPLC